MTKEIRRRDPNSDFSYEVIQTFRSDKVDERNSMDLMVVVWKRCGKPVLEKRRVWHTKKGLVHLRKLVGMNSDDLKFISEHITEIQKLLN
jgi:hypothetical protein